MYIKSNHYKLWLIITNGDLSIIRLEAGWINEDLAIMDLNTKAHYTLTYVFSRNKYNKICKLNTTKEIWDSLSINYKGTKGVQLKKADTLTRHYESFCIKEGGFVDDIFERL